jgi:uncharacterized MAPEG superfamily protein
MTDSLFWLALSASMTAVLWLPYVLEYIGRVGLLPALSLAKANDEKLNATPPWAERTKKAHYNSIENLTVFATLVLIAHSAGMSVLLATQVYFFARLLHYVFYAIDVGALRTLSFFGGFFAQGYVALTLFGVIENAITSG